MQNQYPVLVIPEWEYMEPTLVERIKQYVKNGGYVLVIGAKATRLFDNVLGITEKKEIAPSSRYLGYDKRLAQLNGDYRAVEATGKVAPFAGMFSTTDFRFPAGVAATISQYGKGKIGAVYADLGDAYRVSTSPVIRDFLSGLLQTLFPAPLVTIEGSHKVHVVPATKDGNLLVNLVNTSGDHANPNYSGFDEIPSLRNLKVSVKLAQKPSAVVLQPAGTKVDFTYADGEAVFVIPELKIHTIIKFD